MTPTPKLGLTRCDVNTAQPDVQINEAINAIDAFCGIATIINATTTAPPATPTDGDCYLIATSATGVWTGKDGQIAVAYGGGWINPAYFFAPKPGMMIYNLADGTLKIRNASNAAWDLIGTYA